MVKIISSKIMLYSGQGASPFCTQALENQLRDISDDRVHSISRFNEFSSLGDPRELKAVVVPGGSAFLLYGKSGLLDNEETFKNTLDQHRISYYGACAGAILASSALYLDIPGRIASDRGFYMKDQPFLGLFPGRVIAPLFPKSPEKNISINDFNLLDIRSSHLA